MDVYKDYRLTVTRPKLFRNKETGNFLPMSPYKHCSNKNAIRRGQKFNVDTTSSLTGIAALF